MGKATILSGGPEGSYSIKLDTGEAARTAKVTALDKQLADLVVKIDAAQTKFNAQKVLEDAKQVAVEAAITAYASAGTLAGTTYAAIVPAQTRLDAANQNLRLVNLAPEGTLPDVTKLQATLVDLLAAQVSTAAAAQTSMDNAQAAIDAVSAKKAIFEAAYSAYTAACDDLTAAQSVELVKTQALVAAKQAGGDTAAEQAAYLAATLATGDASTQLTSAKVGMADAMTAMQDAQSLLSNMQGAQALDAGAIDASWRYATAGQELLAIYVADGDVADSIKGSQRANIEALYALYAPQKTVCNVSVGEAGGKAGPLDSASDDQDGRISDALSAASVLQATAIALWVKRDTYVAAALLASAEFTVAQTAYQTAIDSNDQAALDLTQANIDFGDAFDAWALAFDDLQMAVLIAVVDLQNMLLASSDYADAAHPPLHAFYLTPAAITRTHDAAQEEVTNAQAGLSGAKSAYDAANAAIGTTLKAYTKTATELHELRLKTAPLRLTLEGLQATQTQAQKDRTYWAGLVLSETRQAWCADLTEDATGTVATLEIPGESALVLIEPAAPVPTPAHGLLVAREVQSGPQVFWNAAVLPGWQKFKPTYRRGTITAIHAGTDTADVLLTDDRSSAQKLGINQTPTLEKVPVQYMTCHAGAFAVGDKCVVKFKDQDWAQPRIVGFVDHPKSCSLVLSGIVRDGLVVDLPIPPDSPPGTLAKKALQSYKPTAQAWQYALHSSPDKSPEDFADEPVLGNAGTQYADLCASMFSGRMAAAVQIWLGQGIAVPYDYHWGLCHGMVAGADGKLWVVEISANNGVIAQRLALVPTRANSPQDVLSAAHALFGGLPIAKAFAVGDDLVYALAEGSVIQLATPADLAAYFGKIAFVPEMGWSFNQAGSEAHNTCWAYGTVDATQVFSYHYKLAIVIGAEVASPRAPGVPLAVGSAVLTEVESGELTNCLGGGNYEANWIPFQFCDAEGQPHYPPAKQITSDGPEQLAMNAPLVVFFAGDVLEVIRVVYEDAELTERTFGDYPSSLYEVWEFTEDDNGNVINRWLVYVSPYHAPVGTVVTQSGGISGRVVKGQRIRMYRFSKENVTTYTVVAGGAGVVGYRAEGESRTLTGGFMFWTPFCRDSVSRSVDSYDSIFGIEYGAVQDIWPNIDLVGVWYSTVPNPNISEADPRAEIPMAHMQLGSLYSIDFPIPYIAPGKRPGYVATLWPDGTLSNYTDETDVTSGAYGYEWAGRTRLVCSMLGAEPERDINYFRYPLLKGPHIAPEAVTPLPARDYNFLGYV